MAKKIIYSAKSGLEYELAYGTVNISLSPDSIGRFGEAIEKLDEMKKKFAAGTVEDIKATEVETRALFDGVFGAGFCAAAFGDESLFAITRDGDYLFANFFDAFFPELEKDLKAARPAAQPAISPKAQSYLADVPEPAALPDVSGYTAEQKKALLAQLIG